MILTTDITAATETSTVVSKRGSFPKTVNGPATNTASDEGVYIRDSFDFTGNQLGGLGYWDMINQEASKSGLSTNFYDINNDDYRNWRDDHGKGGDFRIYSDVKEIEKTLKITL